MGRENKSSMGRAVVNIFLSFFKLFRDITELAAAEAKRAKTSAANLVLLTFVLGALLTTTWISILGLLIAYLISIKMSLLMSFGCVVGLNVLFLLIVVLTMVKLKNNLFFPATRKQLFRTKTILKDSYRERLTEKN